MPLLMQAAKLTGDARVVTVWRFGYILYLMLWLIPSQVSATAYQFLPPGIRFDSLDSFNGEMEPTALGGADFTRYSEFFSKLSHMGC
jgi:hypothetical protein